MTRLTLRKGFTLQPEPGGSGHLTDTQTGDALLIPAEDYAVLAAAATDGLDPSAPGVVGLLVAYGPFFVEAVEQVKDGSFYELNIEDAPTVIEIPAVAPVTVTEISSGEQTLEAARAAAAEDEPATHEHEPFKQPEEDEPLEEFTQPAGLVPPQPAAVESAPAAAPADEAPEFAAPRTSRRPLMLTLVGLAVLGIMVAVTFALRPGGETTPGGEVPPVTSAAIDASTPEEPVDAGEAVIAAVTPEPVEVKEELDAAVALTEPAVDAGGLVAVQPEPVEAQDPGEWLTAEVTAHDRVKMGEVLSPAAGQLSWTVEEEQRVKTRQVLGSVTREGGAEAPLAATAVGLVMLKQPSGATVKRGEVLAEIIYWEAWAKGTVRGAVPKTTWRCEISSASAQQRADCKISVISPRSGGAQITVAIEPRWFDAATDAVLRVAPP